MNAHHNSGFHTILYIYIEGNQVGCPGEGSYDAPSLNEGSQRRAQQSIGDPRKKRDESKVQLQRKRELRVRTGLRQLDARINRWPCAPRHGLLICQDSASLPGGRLTVNLWTAPTYQMRGHPVCPLLNCSSALYLSELLDHWHIWANTSATRPYDADDR
ncbi:hypothetical protein PYCCODRAFT_776831 [Trametes coccinea BRFM310]|uniref:Uncharacterized protein n=1 Tax=Trametes coccinea (strain BRFM310) TaxID=1353009 RepID=A0A1Y2J247_TRAC3|nr:hypothetical protein PYCCODRAFT_776831 [Trametes coccinea BRFM310]